MCDVAIGVVTWTNGNGLDCGIEAKSKPKPIKPLNESILFAFGGEWYFVFVRFGLRQIST